MNRAGLRAELEIGPPAELGVGRGTAFALAGWCYDPVAGMEALEVEVAGARSALGRHSMPRRDRWQNEPGGGAARARAYRSGFAGVAVVPQGAPAGAAEVSLIAQLSGRREQRIGIGEVRLAPSPAEPPPAPLPRFPTGASGRRVAICMASFDPPPELLRRQLDSIRGQGHRNWVCMISDDGSRPELAKRLQAEVRGDERFSLLRGERLGFYRNFERALALAPECEFVALCDQDDRWRPDKLERLLAGIGGAGLAYSDARVIRPDGAVTEPSYWSVRGANHDNLASLLLANSITGAATLFRRDLLDYVLPFPPAHGAPYHDHWLALVALSRGEIAYVDEPLWDYVQHADAVIGHSGANRPPLRLGRVLRERRRRGGKPAMAVYYYDWLQLRVLMEVLRLRCWPAMSEGKRRALTWLLAAERNPAAAAWLLGRRARRLRGRNETLDRELYFGFGLAGARVSELAGSLLRRPAPWVADAAVPPRPEPAITAPPQSAAPRG